MSRATSLVTLLLQAALIAQPDLGQQRRVAVVPSPAARRSAPAPRRMTDTDRAALAAAEARRAARAARNLQRGL